MKGIYRKEMSQYFHSLSGFIFIAMYLALSGVLFTTLNLLAQNGDIKVYYSAAVILCMLLIPILTMRLFSDERKQKTDTLLLTSPVSLTTIILGKFGATFTVFLIPLAISGIYPVILLFMGVSAPWIFLGNLLGMMLLGAALIAIGLFLSMQTDSQFIAAVLTYSLFVLSFLAGSATTFTGNPILLGILRFVAIAEHCRGLSYGVFPLADILYYLSITALFLFLGVYTLERKRLA